VKGSALLLTAQTAAELAEALETAGRAGTLADPAGLARAKDLCARLEVELGRVDSALASLVEATLRGRS
jgi:hypothetical protein